MRSSDGKYAFFMESPLAQYWTNQEPCDLYMLDEINDAGYGLATNKDAGGRVIAQRLNIALIDIMKSGKLYQLEKKWWKLGECARQSGSPGLNASLSLIGALLTTVLAALNH